MLFTKKTEHIYARIKDNVVNEDGLEEIFLFSGLTKMTDIISNKKSKKKITAVVSKVFEDVVENSPPEYLALNNESIRIVVDKNEFEILIKLSEEDLSSFFLYKSKDH